MPTVMVVDDETVLSEVISMLIEDLGYEPIIATNGAEAIDMLCSGRPLPALIVSDVMMPRLNGIELVKRIRADPLLADIPVILMSAAASATIPTVHFLPKPFDLEELAHLIVYYVAESGRQEQGA
jgi:CheY-like chemotaxis protein